VKFWSPLVLFFFAGSSLAWAASPADDDARNSVYLNDWIPDSNGGHGFGPWRLVPCPNPHYGSSFFVSERGWGVAALNGDIFSAFRDLTAGGPNQKSTLAQGQSISFVFQSGSIEKDKAVGFAFLDTHQNERLNLVGRPNRNYLVHDDAGNHEINLPYTDRPLHVSFVQGANQNFTLSLSPEGEPAIIYRGTSAGEIATVRFWNFGAGPKNSASVYLDHLQVTTGDTR
jgi:hypothetical protein